MIKKKCFYCKKISNIYLRSKNKNIINNRINFASTELYANEFEIKPNLFYCQDNYVDVLDPLYVDQIENKKKYFNNIISKISDQFVASDNVLEIGSYYGAFGSQIASKVKSYTGIELSPHACAYAKRNFNLNVKNQNINEFFRQNKIKFDVIFMFDVIEHLDDPDSVLKLCSNNLNSKGRLIISTMNMDSLFAKLCGSYYQWIIPMHKFYFSDYSIKKFLNKNNLEMYKIINDVRIISLEYLFLKLSQKISLFKYFYKFLINFRSIKNLTIKFSLFDINIYCSCLKKNALNETS